jgi:N-acetylglutamate synthase-like GNAT family acetyltransferase
MRFVIRDYLQADLAGSVHLLETLQDDPDTIQIDLSQFIQDVNEQAPTVVADAQGEIIGLLTARTFGTTAWIMTLAIAPTWRRQGVGTGLMERLERRLSGDGIRRISAVLAPGQIGQQSLLNSGFVQTDGLVRLDKRSSLEPSQVEVISGLGGALLPPGLWDLAAGMAREKALIDSRIVAPLASPALSQRIGLRPPSTALMFGPPGTGKTTFARAIASRLGWPFIELLPSKMSGGGTLAAELHDAFRDVDVLDHVVLFIDEFDELVPARREQPSAAGVVNELLKSIPAFRERPGRLLVCATNFVDTIDPAVLRPGRFDLLIGIGPPDTEALTALWSQALDMLDVVEGIDPASLAEQSAGFTPGDVDLATQRAAAAAFARARTGEGEERVGLADLRSALARTRPSISAEMQAAFDAQLAEYERV